MTTVAIHQPNYLPWLGYFAKMAAADIFVLLDDVQFSKGSYTNRVQMARAGAPVWLTVPVTHKFGAQIREVGIASPDWTRGHVETLKQAYRKAARFSEVWPELERWLAQASGSLADINSGLIRQFAARLGLSARLTMSSELPIAVDAAADQRLALIVAYLAPGGTYLSGAGGAKYQTEPMFAAHGLKLAYSTFKLAPYACSGDTFLPGLSVVDALFHLGWEETAAIVHRAT